MIYLIDDEYSWIKGYIEAIELSGKEIMYFENTDLAWNFFIENEPNKKDILILDIMMPAGERYRNNNTQNGRITGELFYRDLKSKFSYLKTIILTNKNREENIDKFILDSTIFASKESVDSIDLLRIIEQLEKE